MNDDQEARHAYDLLAALPEDERIQLERAYGAYLTERQQLDEPARHRDFILGWIACYDTHGHRPLKVVVQLSMPAVPPPIMDLLPAERELLDEHKRRRDEQAAISTRLLQQQTQARPSVTPAFDAVRSNEGKIQVRVKTARDEDNP
jgi:hypothetical protein